jgi:hypothetical protein
MRGHLRTTGLTRAALLAVLLLPLLLTACVTVKIPIDALPGKAPDAHPTPASGPKGPSVVVFLTKGSHLVEARRAVGTREQTVENALSLLFEGPTSAEGKTGISSAIPEGTALRSVSLDYGGTAHVDVTRQFASGMSGAGPRLRVAQIVYTAMRFSQVKGVVFRIEGKTVKRFGSAGPDLMSPRTAADYSDVLR